MKIRPFPLQILICFTVLCISISSFGQQLISANKIGGSGADQGNAVFRDSDGNTYVGGKFSGSNIDFDPSAGNFLMSSAGNTDGFVVKYSAAGAFIWAFRFGGSNLDEVNELTVDALGNILISGFFRGANVDFDPGPGTALLTSNGDAGGDPGYGGDIYVAKYTTNGEYIWAFHIGGPNIGDNSTALLTDPAGNVYVGGYFQGTVDFDPGAGNTSLNWTDGTVYLAKYTPAGVFQWARNWGGSAVDNTLFGMTIDATGNIVATGFFQGAGRDFDPGPGTALLSSNGGFEAYITKFSPTGNFLSAFSIGSTGTDVGRGVVTDSDNNIYVLGDYNGTVDFDPGPGVAPLTSNGSGDVFLAKYTSTGQYLWAFSFGGVNADFGWQLDTDGTHLFITGGFTGTADMNPSAAVENIVSAGGNDIFLGKYNFNGEYLCSFRIGGPANDQAMAIHAYAPGRFFITGSFSNSNIDFDPTTATYDLSSDGDLDVFYANYDWPDAPKPLGTISGGTICPGEPAQLTFTSTAGVGPFVITYSDGLNSYVASNVQTGVPFDIDLLLNQTTTFSLVSIRDAQRCSESNLLSGITTQIVMRDQPVRANNDTMLCEGTVFQLEASGGVTYSWTGSPGLNDPTIANPTLLASENGQFIVTGLGPNGCLSADTINITVAVPGTMAVTSDTIVCGMEPVQLNASGVMSYSWFPVQGFNNPMIANPVLTPQLPAMYYVEGTDVHGCTMLDSVWVGFMPRVDLNATADLQTCYDSQVQLSASGIDNYQWSPATGLNNAQISNPVADIRGNTRYIVSGLDNNGCLATDTVSITIFPVPQISVTNDTLICSNSSITLMATGGQSYTWSPGLSLDNSSIANPLASPDGETKYYVTVTDQYNCQFQDSVTVGIRPIAVFSLPPNHSVCSEDSVILRVFGGDTYTWQPATGLSNPLISNPSASPTGSTNYTVTVTESVCNTQEVLSTTVNVLPVPSVRAFKSGDLSCAVGSVQLSATGARTYIWSPAATLSSSSVANPISSAGSATQYTVVGTGNNGCSGVDSVLVSFDNSQKSLYEMPSAFTPNNDGVNDCYGVSYWGFTESIEFSIFNRWGERIFYSASPGVCWDGTFKGQPLNGDVFVYMIRAKTTCQAEVFKKGTFLLIR